MVRYAIRLARKSLPTFSLRVPTGKARLGCGLSGGVMVAQESLELFVMVRIHAGQPTSTLGTSRQAVAGPPRENQVFHNRRDD